MAIYGVGSVWGEEGEVIDRFFQEERFIIGWNHEHATDLYSLVSSIKTGDIIYAKSNHPGSRTLRIKGIGIVTKNFIECLIEGKTASQDVADWQSLHLNVNWILRQEFIIEVPENTGKLTGVRASTIYEEFSPFVQESVVNRIIQQTYIGGGA